MISSSRLIRSARTCTSRGCVRLGVDAGAPGSRSPGRGRSLGGTPPDRAPRAAKPGPRAPRTRGGAPLPEARPAGRQPRIAWNEYKPRQGWGNVAAVRSALNSAQPEVPYSCSLKKPGACWRTPPVRTTYCLPGGGISGGLVLLVRGRRRRRRSPGRARLGGRGRLRLRLLHLPGPRAHRTCSELDDPLAVPPVEGFDGRTDAGDLKAPRLDQRPAVPRLLLLDPQAHVEAGRQVLGVRQDLLQGSQISLHSRDVHGVRPGVGHRLLPPGDGVCDR